MIIIEPRLDDLHILQQSEGRQLLLDELFISFRMSFPRLEFQLVTDNSIINAQAISLGNKRYVRLYGGLAFHPFASRDAIAFLLLHEVGHHLARGCRLPWDPRLACECVADHWAATEGATVLRSVGGAYFRLKSALRQIDLILAKNGQSADELSCDNVKDMQRESCWALNWPKRWQNVIQRKALNIATCPLSTMLLSYSKQARDLGGSNGYGAGE
jgi:hypothetical protein